MLWQMPRPHQRCPVHPFCPSRSPPYVDGCDTPTIAVLYEDTKEQRHVKTYEVSLRDKVQCSRRWREWCSGVL